EKEARATGTLNHPNILAIYDIGSHEGSPYLVEELLEGQTLREALRSGPLPARRAVEVAVQVAHGLAAAHGKGIIHRDLKPENLFVTAGGHVKILDFGLAKLAEARLGGDLEREAETLIQSTEYGVVVGTVGYMSPEQVRGLPCDHRADIFALGCVLYEMVSGRRAFTGPTPADTMSAILSKEPQPLAEAGGEIPAALQGIVDRCLEKRPEDRFSSAHDLALALEAASQVVPPSAITAPAPWLRRRWLLIGAAAAAAAVLAVAAVLVLKVAAPGREAQGTKPPKIVVLPFENLGSPEDAYFASGMADEITSRLANVQGLGVISRTTAAQYEHTRKTVKQIAAELGVDYVLEGSVRWEHNQGKESRVRITPQLIRVVDDTHVWADRYDRVLADVFAMQSEVAESAVAAMGVALLPQEKSRLAEISTDDLEAYDLYLRGMELFARGETCEMFGDVLEKFQAAVDRDPRFAQALAMTASTHLAMFWIDCEGGQEHLDKGRQTAERAIELRPDLALPHQALGDYFYRGLQDCRRALEEYAAALTIQPSNALALLQMGMALRFQGRWEEAVSAFSKGLELDPKNVHLLHHFAVTCIGIHRYAEADRALGLAIALSPQWDWPYGNKAELQVQWHGDLDTAQAILEQASHVAGINESFLGTWRWLALLRRDYPEVLRLLEEEERQIKGDDLEERSAIFLLRGQAQVLMGEGDLARRSYEAARVELEKKIAQDPDDAGLRSSLGIAYAGLGRHTDAVREARLGCDPMPVTKCGMPLTWCLRDMALVYTMVAQPSEAIAKLDELLSRNGSFTAHTLRLDPTWDPLRSDPRFQALLTKYEVKE
ncbi:MAG: hypothetical protein C3F15_13940, partial [Holophagae bacterium]